MDTESGYEIVVAVQDGAAFRVEVLDPARRVVFVGFESTFSAALDVGEIAAEQHSNACNRGYSADN